VEGVPLGDSTTGEDQGMVGVLGVGIWMFMVYYCMAYVLEAPTWSIVLVLVFSFISGFVIMVRRWNTQLHGHPGGAEAAAKAKAAAAAKAAASAETKKGK